MNDPTSKCLPGKVCGHRHICFTSTFHFWRVFASWQTWNTRGLYLLNCLIEYRNISFFRVSEKREKLKDTTETVSKLPTEKQGENKGKTNKMRVIYHDGCIGRYDRGEVWLQNNNVRGNNGYCCMFVKISCKNIQLNIILKWLNARGKWGCTLTFHKLCTS